MKNQDARLLSPAAQETLRVRVVTAIEEDKVTPTEAARIFGVSRQAIYNWISRKETAGARGLKSQKRGPKKISRLAPHQAATTVRCITDRCPDQLKLPFALWTREAVQNFLQRRFGVSVSVWTVGRYLKRWGMTPQKPLRRAFEQDTEAVRRWLQEEYPKIATAAKRENAQIHWGDEMGLRSDHQTGTTYGKRGQTPVIPGTGQRFRCNMISTVTNRGKLAFMVFQERFTAQVFVEFLRRLTRHATQKVFLIVDGHPVHRSGPVNRWLREHADLIQMYRLPPYSPELNPDELLNQDVKSNALGRQRPLNLPELLKLVRTYLRSTQRRPDVVCSYFREAHVCYAS